MDWGRAKTVLIISFLLLNAMLGYELWNSRLDLGENIDVDLQEEEVTRLMASREIRLIGEIPKDTPRLSQIDVQTLREQEPGFRQPVQPPIPYERLLSRGTPKNMFTRTIPDANLYTLDSATSRDDELHLLQMYHGYPMFEVRLVLHLEGGDIAWYRQTLVAVRSSSEVDKLIPAVTALRSLVETYLPRGSTIRDIRLGYHGQFFDAETNLLVPSWRVALDSGELFYVNALNGAVDDPQKGAVVAPDETESLPQLEPAS